MNYMAVKRNNTPVSDFDKLFDSLFRNDQVPSARVPAVDIVEREGDYEITAELPGFSEKELDIQVKDNLLTISAGRKENKSGGKHFLKRERPSVAFKRSFYLPKDASANDIEAVFANGLLTLSVAKKEEAKPVFIKVKNR